MLLILFINPLEGTLKPQRNGPLSSDAVIGTPAVTFGCYIWYCEDGPRLAVALPSPPPQLYQV